MRHVPDVRRPPRVSPAACVALTLACLAAVTSAQLERKATPRPILILGGTLIDGSGKPPEHNGALTIADGRVKAIDLDAIKHAPKDARRIDATGKWILPGLVDSHVHLFRTGGLDASPDRIVVPGGRPFPDIVNEVRRSPAAYLRAYICAGVTSVVDLGGPTWVFDVRDSRGDDALAPRIAFSGPALAVATMPAALHLADAPFWMLKSEDDAAAAVARLVARKANLVSVDWSSADGPGTGDGSAGAQEARVLQAIVAASHRAGLRVAVRAVTLETARRAVEAGADILSHGVTDREVDDAFVASLVARKTIYVPALIANRGARVLAARNTTFEPIERSCGVASAIDSFSTIGGLPEDAVRVPLPPDTLAVEQRNLKRLAYAGVVVAAGTEAGTLRTLHGPSLHLELELMAAAGLSASQVLLSATRNGALVMNRERDVGQLKAGMLGDLVVLDGDPLADIRNTRRISTVVRGGTIYER